jgi:hypothetical protein
VGDHSAAIEPTSTDAHRAARQSGRVQFDRHDRTGRLGDAGEAESNRSPASAP